VVAIEDGHVTVLRDGAITREALAEIVEVHDISDERDRTASPGHDVRHYSPRTPTVATTAPPTGSPAGDMIYAGYLDRPVDLPDRWRLEALGEHADLRSVGRNLYATLRRLDRDAPALIVVELTRADGIGRAIDDRLTRAASGLVFSDSATLADWIASRSP
jgi:L-threonylcarbamoyladenylate synthase